MCVFSVSESYFLLVICDEYNYRTTLHIGVTPGCEGMGIDRQSDMVGRPSFVGTNTRT